MSKTKAINQCLALQLQIAEMLELGYEVRLSKYGLGEEKPKFHVSIHGDPQGGEYVIRSRGDDLLTTIQLAASKRGLPIQEVRSTIHCRRLK